MKRINTLIVIMALLLLCPQTVTFAKSSDDLLVENEESQRKNELSSLVEKSLQDEFEGINVDKTSEWVKLYDVNLTPYAYFVPLLDENKKMVGYSVISDINGNNTILCTSEGFMSAQYASHILLAAKDCKEGDCIVYAFPDAFFVKNTQGFLQICLSGEKIMVTDVTQFDAGTSELLSESVTERHSDTGEPGGGITGSLNKWDYHWFVPVSEGSNVYYGGNQAWLTDEGVSSFWANRACGLTAAANAMYYMSKYVSGKTNLYTNSGITKAHFSSFQKQLYDYCLSPAIWGIPDLSTMKLRVEQWAAYRNVSLSGVLNNSPWNVENVRRYIVNGLNRERPVLLQTWNSPIPELSWHWVTVIRLYYNTSSNTLKIVTSNWSSKVEYDFVSWCNGLSLYKSVIYFD